jgi:hypothetical protein
MLIREQKLENEIGELEIERCPARARPIEQTYVVVISNARARVSREVSEDERFDRPITFPDRIDLRHFHQLNENSYIS